MVKHKIPNLGDVGSNPTGGTIEDAERDYDSLRVKYLPLQVGQEIVFEDMIHYTTVKTTMFNGIMHPSIVLEHEDGTREELRRYTYEDYRDRMD